MVCLIIIIIIRLVNLESYVYDEIINCSLIVFKINTAYSSSLIILISRGLLLTGLGNFAGFVKTLRLELILLVSVVRYC